MLIQGLVGTNSNGQDQRFARIDLTTHALKVISYEHSEAHNQNAYLIVYSALKDDTESFEVRIGTADTAKRAHMTIHLDAALAATAELWVDTTKTDASGNRLTALNRDFESTNTSVITACHTPGGSQTGTANLIQYIGAATASGRADVGGSGGSRSEFKLKRNTAYLFKMTSRANGNAMTIMFDWYDHTDKT
jgi:hypothetical protein